MNTQTPRWLAFLALGVVTLVLAGLFYGPLAFLLLLGLTQTVGSVQADDYISHLVQFTYTQAILSALVAALPGMVGAVLYAESMGRWRRLWSALALVPFALPPVLVVLGLLGVWGRHGVMGRLLQACGVEWNGVYGWTGILLAHALFNFPLYIRLVGQALESRDRVREQAALSLGCGRVQCFLEVTWPGIRLAFWSAFGLSFLFSASSFLVVLLLGGGPRFTTIEVAVFQAIKQDFNLGYAVRLALIQLGVAAVMCLWVLRHSPALILGAGLRVPIYGPRSGWGRFWVFGGYTLCLLLLAGLPLGAILFHGLPGLLRPELWAWSTWVSLRLAFAAGAVAVALAALAAYGAKHAGAHGVRLGVSILCTLPLAVSSLLILLAWRMAAPVWFTSGTRLFLGVVLVQAVLALGIVYRPVESAFARLSSQSYRVARSLGASPWQVLIGLELPACRNALALAWLLGCALSLGEAGAVLLFLDESTMNLTYLVYQTMGRYRFLDAHAAGCVLLLLTAVVCLFAARLEREGA